MTKNLWGNIPTTGNLTPPVAILREQAALLGDATNNRLEARVGSATKASYFEHTMGIVAPALDNYSVSLIRVVHDVGLYPVSFFNQLQPAPQKVVCADQGAFEGAIQAVLSSPEVHKIIDALMSQIGA